MTQLDFERIKQAATGRWAEILQALTPLTGEELRKGSNDHPCPLCNGSSVIWPATDAQETGRIACRKCTDGKPTGDGIGTVATFADMTQGEAGKAVASYLGIDGASYVPKEVDVIEQVCKAKRMPVEAFKQFGAYVAKSSRAKGKVARVPVYNEKGETHSYFDLTPTDKGFFKRGKGSSGMFFPGRLPKPGETWVLVEGVKDASALVGLGYLAAGLPTSEMPAKFARLFKGVHVILCPDLDVAGQTGATKTGGRLV